MKNQTNVDIDHISRLANLPLSEQEKEKYQESLPKIIDYFKKISEVDTSTVTPTFNTTPLENVWRNDEAKTLLSQEQTLQNVSETEKGFIKAISDK